MKADNGSFAAELAALDATSLSSYSLGASDRDVDRALVAEHLDPRNVAALLSPAAAARLEELATVASRRTLRRFGRAVRLFAPLYVSNECLSSCTYCGFAKDLAVVRLTLTSIFHASGIERRCGCRSPAGGDFVIGV